MRHPTPDPPAEIGTREGLAYARFDPSGAPRGAILIFHGAGSCKENHFDFARAARTSGFVAIAYDQRGHGASAGAMDARVLEDAAAIARLMPPDAPLALRGSSMGGYLALLAAERLDARAVVAICPASAELLLRALRAGLLEFTADLPALEAFLSEHPLEPAVAGLRAPLLVIHAEGDERVAIEGSRALVEAAAAPVKRLIAVPGGDHRSAQHDPELQGETLRFVARALAGKSL